MADTRAILENIFGLLGIIFWSFQLLPQVWDNYKTKQVEGLSASMFLIWTVAALGFGSYALIERLSIPIIVQPQIFGVLSTLCFLQCMYYTSNPRWKWSLRTTIVGGVLLYGGMAAVEASAYFSTKAGLDNDVEGTIEAAGILPVILLGIGFLPQYVDIFRDRSVVSVNMVFIVCDALGSIFSIISLAFRDVFDLLAALNYVMVLICDLIVVLLWVYFNKLHPELSRVPPAEKREMGMRSDVDSIETGAYESCVKTSSITIVDTDTANVDRLS
ncbi:hypothetical protein DFQ26_001639 [Actinomortierella ambigua]|nr:hypothetical protein DFQ26_001639 [Actinomortierella ambigua]